ncbi:MAG TPA: hypothetical protein VHE83_11345, partial [Mycobacteriales bacterium]|nr:hypothetical protein [Mycobacteriales bacterium]
MARRPTYRPGIRLIILVLLIVGSYLYLGLAGATPRLGVDLAGGTTVTLEPRGLCDGKSVSNAQLDQAVNILRQRVNGFGVSEADVVRNGKFIVITVPGKDRNGVLSTVGQTAQLFFRQVVAAEPDPSYQEVAAQLAKASASAAPSASASPSLPGPGLGSIEVSGSAKASASASPAVTSAAPSATSTVHGRPAPQLGLGPLAGPAGAAVVATSTPTPTSTLPTPTPTPTPTASASTSPADETAVQCAAEAANAAADSASPSPSVSASPSPSVSAPVSAPISPRVTPSATSTAHGRPLPFAAAASASAKPSASARASASAKPSPSPSASPTPSLTPEQQLDQPPAQCQGATGSKKTACDQWGNLHCGVVAEGRGTALPDAVEAVLRPSTGDTWALGCSRIGANPPDYKYLLAPAAPPCTKASTKDTPCGALGTDVKSGSVVANPKTTGTAQTQIVTNDWVVDLD